MLEIKRRNRLSQALVHFVIDRALLFTEHRISSRPMSAKKKHFRTILEHTFEKSTADFNSSYFWNGGRQCMELILCRVVESSCLPSHNIVPHILGMAFHIVGPRKYRDFPSTVIFQLLLRKFWIQTWFGSCQQYLCFISLSLSTSKVHMIEERCLFSQVNFFVEYFPHRIDFCFFPAN